MITDKDLVAFVNSKW